MAAEIKPGIVLIGAGNVALHMGKALLAADFKILQVYSKTQEHAEKTATLLGAQAITSLQEINKNVAMGIVAVKDQALRKVLQTLPFHDKLWVHTSGTTSLKVIARIFPNSGVIYPLQTFSAAKEINFKEVPLFIEASNDESLRQIQLVCNAISEHVAVADSNTRKAMHVAAVFACNFTNHLYALAGNILQEKKISFDVLKPLILETVQKLDTLDPLEAQTGPAARGDKNIIREHRSFLKEKKMLKKIYTVLSESISNLEQSKHKKDAKF
jgi:predicted short-subunit dehydrogenase-like oxidoreductase (DUF2520 family)